MRLPKLPVRKVTALPLSAEDGRMAHMAASILLDYPSEERRARFSAVAASVTLLPDPLRHAFEAFLTAADAMSQQELEIHFTATFDLKRKCCPYLSYYAAGDTRRRGMALVRFVEAYRAAGWEVAADELPDYLPMVLEFSALSESPIAQELLAAHRDGIEVLRTALEAVPSPYAHVVEVVSLSLPKIDEETRQRYLDLVNEGPPTETVGMTFLGNLKPFSPSAANSEDVRV
ncbi:nitrate reductase molybdenum cofactor assembly chaperone [Cryobacterium sp. TMT1-21]|uniref:Nitrate reductase molybdenum cofactor assembly chaperone n=1 Tax=Cryobacterium shii TaxID=1259235 RepID=A0AAQ2C8F5_9MICO|nr:MULTISPECIES: nitrate reductase molybdenum cofactor assembly chaperone [Cryobacterium]TFC52145.1 nitrate reductase molybdenum cofactor assembly chaperone [Cryobacterium shii]TFC84699.1 nitrate reductase molybdenum cofactor assembly chaperone [Cryobacterium sp. TmT2-59]TFD15728.1 nitrate reductase molybdenum cofactor assembly chaperone [Cryobacterium sp. TMT1-21]TFD19424.1 nitrate reductase molybdenum cofactor assembly chaperone [Cryobacterium sp. TMT4-10]TFD26741.1 nitrate reductase molybde